MIKVLIVKLISLGKLKSEYENVKNDFYRYKQNPYFVAKEKNRLRFRDIDRKIFVIKDKYHNNLDIIR